jgi:hypothetical protein
MAKVEWQDGEFWRSVKAKLSFTRNSNQSFKHNGKTYVFKNLKEGNEVFCLENGKWVKAGRIDRYGTIFLGEGETHAEMMNRVNADKTPEQLLAEIRGFMSN